MATWSGSPTASDQDAAEVAAGTVIINGTGLNANNTSDMVGIIFPSVTIPPGSTINSATMTLNFSSGTFDDPDLTIWGLDSTGSGSAFTTASNDISSRGRTSASVAWTDTGVGTGTEVTPDLTAIVQERISSGWTSGFPLGFVLIADSNSSNFRVNSYDNGADYPILDIDYTAPGGGQPTRTMHQFRQRANLN